MPLNRPKQMELSGKVTILFSMIHNGKTPDFFGFLKQATVQA